MRQPLEIVALGLIQGAAELVPVSSSAHVAAVPWLLAFATVVLAFGRRLTAALRLGQPGPAAVLAGQFVLAIYGGYFGGAVGLMMLAFWTATTSLDPARGNPLRVMQVAAVYLTAAVIFVFAADVACHIRSDDRAVVAPGERLQAIALHAQHAVREQAQLAAIDDAALGVEGLVVDLAHHAELAQPLDADAVGLGQRAEARRVLGDEADAGERDVHRLGRLEDRAVRLDAPVRQRADADVDVEPVMPDERVQIALPVGDEADAQAVRA